VNALSQKFNLNSTEVKNVIDTVMTTERTNMQAKRDQNLADRLAKAVTAGKITQAQSSLISAKIQETKTFMESLKNKTDAERKAAMTTFKSNLESWATSNNIPKEFVMMGGMKGMGGKGHGKFGDMK
jgi:TRAP-type mannitol/chloroaromatic compound transport system substrate-binding protein